MDWRSKPMDRIEFGHRMAADFPDRASYVDADRVFPCDDWTSGRGEVRSEPCGPDPTINGFPMDHVWRRHTIGDWHTGSAPDLDAEMTAGTPQNLAALLRLLEGWCSGRVPADLAASEENRRLAEVLADAETRVRSALTPPVAAQD